MTDPLFRFTMRVAEKDLEGYYITRWDRAHKLTVIGATQSEAIEKAFTVLGKPRRGWRWTVRIDSSDELYLPEQQLEHIENSA